MIFVGTPPLDKFLQRKEVYQNGLQFGFKMALNREQGEVNLTSDVLDTFSIHTLSL